MSLHVTATRTGGPLRCEVAIGEHVVVTDEPASLGGLDTAPTPHQLLPAALAACVATMIELYAARRSWDLGEVEAAVDYDPDATPRRFDVHVHIPVALSPMQVQRLARVADTCPVRRALSSEVVVEHHLHHAGSAGDRAA